jgi:plasmid stabilization system protein ParE
MKPRGKTYRVKWTPTAERDLTSVLVYIKQDRPRVARALFRKIRKTADSLKKNPERGRHLPEFEHLRGLPFRELPFMT